MVKKIFILIMIILLTAVVSCKNTNDSYEYTIWNIGFRLTENKEERKINDNILNNYLYSYGILAKVLKIKFLGYDSGSSIRGVHGWLGRTWIRAYEIRAPFMEKPFEVWIDNRTHEIFGNNFYETLVTDPKFQHLYSNWVKKQVGIEDENVELYFNRASCGSRNIGDKLYIDFEKITSLENLEEQICENIHNLYIRSNHYEQGVDIKVDNIDEITEVLNYADLIEDKINSRVFIDNNHFMPSENNHLFISFNVQNGENDLDIKYDYDSNTKMYRYHNKDSEWIEYE